MMRKMTPSEQEDLTVALVKADVLRRRYNAVTCAECGKALEYMPNNTMFVNCIFVGSECCEECNGYPISKVT